MKKLLVVEVRSRGRVFHERHDFVSNGVLTSGSIADRLSVDHGTCDNDLYRAPTAPGGREIDLILMIAGVGILSVSTFTLSTPTITRGGHCARFSTCGHGTRGRWADCRTVALLAIGILTIQLGGYNILVPLLMQSTSPRVCCR